MKKEIILLAVSDIDQCYLAYSSQPQSLIHVV